MKCLVVIFFIKAILIDGLRKDICEKCISKEQCPAFSNMDIHKQESWMKQFPCDGLIHNTTSILGFATIAKGDKVCCPSSQMWGINQLNQNAKISKSNSSNTALVPEYQGVYDQPYRRNPFLYGNQNSPNNQNAFGNPGYNPNYYGNQNYPNQNMYRPIDNQNQPNLPINQNMYGQQQPGGRGQFNQNLPINQGGYRGQANFPRSPGYFGNDQTRPVNQNLYGPQQSFPRNMDFPGNQNIYAGQQNVPVNQDFPGNQGSPLGSQENRPGFSGDNQNTPGDQNIYPGEQYVPGQNSINGVSNPGNANGDLPNQNIGGQFNTPGNPNLYNNLQNINRPSYPGSNAINNPWGNQNIPAYQNNPQANIPNQVQPGALTPSTPSVNNPNPYYQPKIPQQNQNSYEDNIGNDNSQKLSQECKRMKTSFPPSPETGCCGKDMSDAERITDLQSLLNLFAPSGNNWNQAPPARNWPNYQRRKRSLKNVTTDVTLENRIAGGMDTELDQFPWTALLKTTFDYGDKTAAFSCGGSLISRRYVLTAGHCVYEPKARISDVEITLAEYDKRTFPIDCITVFGGGRECVRNIVLHAEDVVHHPEYDDDRLLNDIALIRLDAFAPYTRYIRPICLPSINIDLPEFSNLPLAVAGWGRDGKYVTNIKQSTVVHLVPPEDCMKSYPHLTKSHICAAGRTGEDTCKGDSGGPLMMLYRDSYYVIGIVSGKRADTPCGSKVPSLYTNVFQFVNWIRSTIRE
ncbi:protein masquerade-like [Zerene cesonia]|uniref:protein masquerade-like n=1 Tax=Zerene cesonia TaxID=33412 RepID=UPI0018E500A5|nr:protein masquerade-like [Zerene cesonia]